MMVNAKGVFVVTLLLYIYFYCDFALLACYIGGAGRGYRWALSCRL